MNADAAVDYLGPGTFTHTYMLFAGSGVCGCVHARWIEGFGTPDSSQFPVAGS